MDRQEVVIVSLRKDTMNGDSLKKLIEDLQKDTSRRYVFTEVEAIPDLNVHVIL